MLSRDHAAAEVAQKVVNAPEKNLDPSLIVTAAHWLKGAWKSAVPTPACAHEVKSMERISMLLKFLHAANIVRISLIALPTMPSFAVSRHPEVAIFCIVVKRGALRFFIVKSLRE